MPKILTVELTPEQQAEVHRRPATRDLSRNGGGDWSASGCRAGG
ncbi:hypothetical protein [Streptomyces lunaelactis]|nr:hypothetical protein [Streptomyces lunaelactis]